MVRKGQIMASSAMSQGALSSKASSSSLRSISSFSTIGSVNSNLSAESIRTEISEDSNKGGGVYSGGGIYNFNNDYTDHFLRSGVFPQEHIRNGIEPLVGYPKLQKLHDLKEKHNYKYAIRPFGLRLPASSMTSQLQHMSNYGLYFDVIMINGCLDTLPKSDLLLNLPIQQLTPRPSIIFLWVPSHGLELARTALENWGFRRSEDIVYFARNNSSLHFPSPDPGDIVLKSTWHCLMGLKGTLRRSEDGDLINCNIDTDVIIDNPAERPNIVPEYIYNLIENFSLMNRRLHIIPGRSNVDKPVRPRPGWLIVSPDILLDNFHVDSYLEAINQAGPRVPVDMEIDNLRPRTPPKSKRGGTGKQ